jgi:hypothetical protein
MAKVRFAIHGLQITPLDDENNFVALSRVHYHAPSPAVTIPLVNHKWWRTSIT